jgi:hypothetical protein
MKTSKQGFLSVALTVFVCSYVFTLSEIGVIQATQAKARSLPANPTPTPQSHKPMSDYRGVTLGMKVEDIRLKLGEPKDKSDDMDMYMFGDTETAQFYYDEAHLVKAMMITYTGDLANAPTPKAVFGEDAEAKPDGSIFKMVRYPKAGYWISYNRSGGTDQVISLAFQKI